MRTWVEGQPAQRGLVEELPLRTFIRSQCERDGALVATDLDLVLRRFSKRDPVGVLALVEHKCNGAPLLEGQQWTFAVLDELLRRGDPAGRIYRGLHTVRTDDPFDGRLFNVTGTVMDGAEFAAWIDNGCPGNANREPFPWRGRVGIRAMVADRLDR